MYTPFKMKGKSPMMKKLIGKQHRLPEHLKAKIMAAPESPAKKRVKVKDMPRKQQMAVKATMADGGKGAPTKMMKKSPAKAMSKAAKNLLKAVPNKKAYDKLSEMDKRGFDKAAKKAGLPTKSAMKLKKSTAREQRIARNKEFLPIAIKKGLAPKRPKAGDLSPKGRADLKAYEKFYGNKENVRKLNKAQQEYFKNKKSAVKMKKSAMKKKTKMLKGTTVFGKEVNKKNVKRAVAAYLTGGASEFARTKTGKKVIKGVKKATGSVVRGVKKAVKNLKSVPKEALRTGPVVRSKAKAAARGAAAGGKATSKMVKRKVRRGLKETINTNLTKKKKTTKAQSRRVR